MVLKKLRRAMFGVVALFVLALFGFASADTALAADSPTVYIGATPAREGQIVGHKSASDKLRLTITLNLRDAAGLARLIEDQSNPASSLYKKFITPAQFGERYGATRAQEAAVVRYLQSNGFSITHRGPEHTSIGVETTVAKAERAFGSAINTYRTANGRQFYAPANAPRVPASIAPTVKGILGLDSFEVWHTASKFDNSQPHPNTGPAGGYTPAELRGAYDVAPLTSAGYDGTGQKVALFELDGFNQTNITTYVNNYGLGSPAPTKVLVDGYNGAANQAGGEAEVELDIEVINAIAPKANIAVYEGPNTNAGVLDTYQKIATNNTEKVISTSWGLCEASSGTSTLSSLDTVFQQFASQGQSAFAASGDDGAYDCARSGSTTTLAVDNPADDPYITGVGGTNLTVSGTTYSSERVWSNTTNKSGGGGGVSTYFAHPSWQTGTGTNTGIKRQVPDVSADADPASGYSIYTSYCDQNGANCATKWTVFGGTSAAAPLWAGITAVHNQYAAASSKPALGYANPTLYSLFRGTQTYPAFHDITTGNNLYYSATTGYDMATGIGTPDAYNLIRDLVGGSTGGGGTTPGELILNGGYESGNANWTESSSGGYEIVDTTRPHTGTKSAYLVGYNNGSDSLYQTISVPASATTVTLTYWTYITTQETSTTAYDKFSAQVRNTSGTVLATLQSLSNGSTKNTWVKSTYSLNSYKGQTIRVYFSGTNDSSLPTSFFLDDVSVAVS